MTISISENSLTNPRLLAELQLLEKVAKTVILGRKTIDSMTYHALLIKGMPRE